MMKKSMVMAMVAGLVWGGSLQSQAQTTGFRFAGVDVPPPLAAQNVQDIHWGVSVDDPYRFLEQVKDPVVMDWMKGQAQATESILKRIPARAAILQALKEKESAGGTVISSIYQTKNKRWFYLKRGQGQSQAKLVWRDGLNGEEKLWWTLSKFPKKMENRMPRPMANCWLTACMRLAQKLATCTSLMWQQDKRCCHPLTAFDLRVWHGDRMVRACFIRACVQATKP
jgi:hypothetical protein